MTLALTGASGQALPPAAREAIQHAVAAAVPGIGGLLYASHILCMSALHGEQIWYIRVWCYGLGFREAIAKTAVCNTVHLLRRCKQ